MTTNNEAGLESSLGLINYLLPLTIYELIHSVVWLLVGFGVAIVLLGLLPTDGSWGVVGVIAGLLTVGILAPDKLSFGQGRGSWTLGKEELHKMEAGLGRKELILVRAVISFFLLALIYVCVRLVIEWFAGSFLRSAIIVKSGLGSEQGQGLIYDISLIMANLHIGEAAYWLGRRVRNIVG
jgi:hypothetical protein